MAGPECFQIDLESTDINGVPPPQFASPFDFDQGLARLILPPRTSLAVPCAVRRLSCMPRTGVPLVGDSALPNSQHGSDGISTHVLFHRFKRFGGFVRVALFENKFQRVTNVGEGSVWWDFAPSY